MNMDERVNDLGEHFADLTGRVSDCAERLGTVGQDVAVIKWNYATRADVLEAKNTIIMWVVGAFFLTQLLPALLKKFGL